MKIKMKTLAAGPDGLYQPGQEVEVSAAQAQAFIEAGYAEPGKKRRETATVKATEQATIPVVEVPGIEGKHLAALATLGIRTVKDLAGAHDGAIAKMIPGVGKVTAGKWIRAAREILRLLGILQSSPATSSVPNTGVENGTDGGDGAGGGTDIAD